MHSSLLSFFFESQDLCSRIKVPQESSQHCSVSIGVRVLGCVMGENQSTPFIFVLRKLQVVQ